MKVQGLLLDVEGTLVADKRYGAVYGAIEFIAHCRTRELPIRLITNNTTDSRATLVKKLTDAGFDFAIAELHTCIGAAINHLRQASAMRCLVLGSPELRGMLAEAGLEVTDEGAVDAVVVGLDTELTYERLRLACEAVRNHGASLLALHRNRLYTDSEGRCSPSVGAIVEAIRYATHVEPVTIGKPSPQYYQQALDDIGLTPEYVLVVSDDPFSDLAGAKSMNMQTAFVLSGKYTDRAILDTIPPAEQPDFTVRTIGDLLDVAGLELEAPTQS